MIVKKPAQMGSVSLVSVGDILMGDAAAPALKRNGNDWAFEKVQPLLNNADVVIGNPEGPLTNETQVLSTRKKYSYKVDPQSAPALKRAGFDALSLANNHTLDYGILGMRETISVLKANNIEAFGAGGNDEEARRALEPLLLQFQTSARWSGDTAFIGFAPNWKTANLPAGAKAKTSAG